MGLQEFWFILVAVLFIGFFILEGFDFGVGMLMEPLGGWARTAIRSPDAAEKHRRAVLNTIGPVWDGNEVWLITAGGAMFAAFPGWYATVFSGLYLPLLAILFAMILRIVAIEWRGKINDPRWRTWADVGIAVGSWLPADPVGHRHSPILVRGAAGGRRQADATGRSPTCINPYTLLGGLATCGAVPVARRGVPGAEDRRATVRANALAIGPAVALPVVVIVGAFGVWTELAHGKTWTWLVLGVAVIALLVAVWLLRAGTRDGWAFVATTVVVAAVIVHDVRRSCIRTWCPRRSIRTGA